MATSTLPYTERTALTVFVGVGVAGAAGTTVGRAAHPDRSATPSSGMRILAYMIPFLWGSLKIYGDSFTPVYAPGVVIISENKDTAINFPELPGTISVEGVGKGGRTFAAFDWLVDAPVVIYWGDMDADGLEILDGFRAAGVPARSILMGRASFDRWERYGTNVDKKGAALTAREPRPVPHLTDEERKLYLDLVHPSWSRKRRIEQERIPLAVALAEVLAASDD